VIAVPTATIFVERGVTMRMTCARAVNIMFTVRRTSGDGTADYFRSTFGFAYNTCNFNGIEVRRMNWKKKKEEEEEEEEEIKRK
jgi:hypothetical protein